jgi:hypothetical protein
MKVGDKVEITTFQGGKYTPKGTGKIADLETVAAGTYDEPKRRLPTGRFMVLVDSPEMFACAKALNNVLAFVESELKVIG